MKRALITGIFGQDGSYLAELLSGKDYEVHGISRPNPSEQSLNIRTHLARAGVTPIIHECDLSRLTEVKGLLGTLRPDECYHLAAAHYPSQTISEAQLQGDRELLEQNILSLLNLLYAIKEGSPDTRFVFAGSCLMYDGSGTSPQSEGTAFRSKSVYGTSKIIGHQLTDLFRSLYNLHCSTAILYNHESPRRQPDFVTRKIVQGLIKIKRGELQCLQLGNLHSIKDWGYAADYVRGMWLMAGRDSPADYILATGIGHTVEDFAHETAKLLDLRDWREKVSVKAGLSRPVEQVPLIGSPQKAQTELGWVHSLTFHQLIELMVRQELAGTLD